MVFDNNKMDYILRLDLSSVIAEDGTWHESPPSEQDMIRAALFESLFSYLTMATEDASVDLTTEITPEKIVAAMMKRNELDIMESLSSYKIKK